MNDNIFNQVKESPLYQELHEIYTNESESLFIKAVLAKMEEIILCASFVMELEEEVGVNSIPVFRNLAVTYQFKQITEDSDEEIFESILNKCKKIKKN